MCSSDLGIDGFSTYIARFVEDSLTVIVLLNEETGGAERLAFKIAEVYVPALQEPVKKEIADSNPKLTKMLKEVLSEAVQGRANSDLFDPEVAKTLVPRILSSKAQLSSLGSLKGFVLLSHEEKEGNTRKEYRATFQGMVARVTFSLNKEGKLTGLMLRPE